MLEKISITRLFQTILDSVNKKEYVAMPEDIVTATTIRLDPEIRHYYEEMARELGVSLQSVIKIALTGLMKVSQSENKSEITLLLDRFMELFSSYKIATADIPNYILPHKIPLSALANNDRLLDFLTSEVLEHVATTFNVNVDWLKGYKNTVFHTQHRWYKSADRFCKYLHTYIKSGVHPTVVFISDTSREKMEMAKGGCTKNEDESNVGIMLVIPSKTSSGIAYNKFEMGEPGAWSYKPSRIDLKVIMMFCVRNDISHTGIFLNKTDFNSLMYYDNCLPITIYEKRNERWDPTDYVSTGYHGDTDKEELLDVVRHYCEHYKIYPTLDDEISKGFANHQRFALNLEKYSETTHSAEELMNDSTLEYKGKKAAS